MALCPWWRELRDKEKTVGVRCYWDGNLEHGQWVERSVPLPSGLWGTPSIFYSLYSSGSFPGELFLPCRMGLHLKAKVGMLETGSPFSTLG
jgi:hypothetical protein